MGSALIVVYIIAAIVVAVYSLLRVHALSWTEAPWKMLANIMMSVGAVLLAMLAAYRVLSVGELIFVVGVAINSVANWDRTYCAVAGRHPPRFGL